MVLALRLFGRYFQYVVIESRRHTIYSTAAAFVPLKRVEGSSLSYYAPGSLNITKAVKVEIATAFSLSFRGGSKTRRGNPTK